MEVVLLWLDELDDVLFSAALSWERLRRGLLQVGLAASLALIGTELAAITSEWAGVFSGIAAASVGAWLVSAAAGVFHERQAKGSLTAA